MDENSYRRHIDALEAQNRQLRRIVKLASLSAGLLCILAIAGWKTGGIQDVLTASRLDIVNSEGKTVVVLGVGETQGGVLRIADREQFTVFGAGVNAAGGGFAIEGFDHLRIKRFFVGMQKGNSNVFMEMNSATVPRRTIQIGQLGRNSIGVSLFGEGPPEEGPKPRFQMTLGADEETSLDMYNGKGLPTASWFGMESKSTMMFFADSNSPGSKNLTLNEPAGTVTSKPDDGVGSTWPPPK